MSSLLYWTGIALKREAVSTHTEREVAGSRPHIAKSVAQALLMAMPKSTVCKNGRQQCSYCVRLKLVSHSANQELSDASVYKTYRKGKPERIC